MTNGPHSIGIIMDGNRRWAKAQGLPTLEGHRAGAKKMEEIMAWAEKQSISCVIVYAFSTENWSRDEQEVAALTGLLDEYLQRNLQTLSEKAVIRFIGQRHRFKAETQRMMEEIEAASVGVGKPTLAIALSYGGRADILEGVNNLIQAGVEVITEEMLSSAVQSAGLPDPDLIIRTGGQQRLSNFLTWQSVYSELAFTDTLWPALAREEFDALIETYRNRKRNFGV